MTIARELAGFLTGTSVTDLPAQAVEHAAMLIASTIASAVATKVVPAWTMFRRSLSSDAAASLITALT